MPVELQSDEVQGPPTFGPWSLENYQLAKVIDVLSRLEAITAWVAGNEEFPAPKPELRPGVRPVLRQTAASVTYLNNLRATG